MDPPPPPQRFSQSKRLRTGIIIVALALLAVVIFGLTKSSKNPPPEPPLVWLDQTQFARQMQPGRLKRLYYKVVNLTAPVWQRFRRPKTHIEIKAKILAVYGVTTGELGISAAVATNETGAQVWILSPSDLDDLRQRLKTVSGIDVVNAASIITVGGQPASLAAG